jgi:signal peptidase I
MANSNRWIKPVLSAIGFVIVLTGWLIFAPVNIGGQISYVILIGNSMEPDFKRGDLVLVRDMDSYSVGEIVAYDHPEIGTVFHRIIQQRNNHFTLKGDNNSWNDSFEVTSDEIIGKLWIKIPVAGFYIQYLRSPGMFAFVVTVLGTFGGASLFIEDKPAAAFSNKRKKQFAGRQRNEVFYMENRISERIYTFAVIGFAAFLLAFVSFSRPLEQVVPDNYEYTHNGKIDYFSAVPPGVYEGDILQSGDPVFRQLSNSLNFIFTYGFNTDQSTRVDGTYRLIAEISESSGWIRTFDITPTTSFSGQAFTSTGILDLTRVQELTDNLEQQTGIFNNRYTLTVRPEVTISGAVAGRDLSDTFSPGLAFSFDDQKLELLKDNTDSIDPLNPQEIGIIPGSRSESNTISILGFGLSVLVARIIASYVLFGSLIGLIWMGVRYILSKKNGEIERINSIYGSMLVDIHSGKFPKNTIVEVTDFKELVKIASKDESMINHFVRTNTHHYFVTARNDSGVTYHYQVHSPDPVYSLQESNMKE